MGGLLFYYSRPVTGAGYIILGDAVGASQIFGLDVITGPFTKSAQDRDRSSAFFALPPWDNAQGHYTTRV